MSIGENIKHIRQQREVKQQEIADLVGMHRSNYSKIENGQRELSITALNKVAKFFSITLDELVNIDGDIPEEINISDKATVEKIKLIQEMEEEDCSMILIIIDTILIKKKFKDFFNKNVAAL